MAFPSTKDRVPANTAESINQRLEREMLARVQSYAARRDQIAARIGELESEWDIERVIEANASVLAFIGIALGFFAHPYWLALPALVTMFLFQHAVQGWCPPVPILRWLGFRTVYEIERERQALKAIRGDFAAVELATNKAAAAVAAAA